MERGPVPVGRVVPVTALPVADEPAREILELWLALSRRPWSSVVLVPADRGGSAGAAAAALAEVGQRLLHQPIGTASAERLDYDGATALVDRLVALGAAAARPGAPGRLVLAIPSVVSEPLGVTVARKADLVVLCVRMGRTRVADAQRTIELLGRDRLAGCLVRL
jgi:hypothetical protein